MNRLWISLVLMPAAASAQTYSVGAADVGADIVAGWALGITNDGRVIGSSSVESGRRTFGFVWRDGAIEQLVVPQAGSFTPPPRSFDIHHHVCVLAMSDGGYYAGTGGNVNFSFTLQPYFAWLPHPDPYPPQYVAGMNLFNMLVFDIADTTPLITAVGSGMNLDNRRQAFISLLSKSDDIGNPPRITFLPGFGGAASNSAAYAVNTAGDIVGFASNAGGFHRPFRRPASTGVMSDLGTLGGPSGEAFDISDSGYIVGQADVAAGRPHAFRRLPAGGPLADLGTLGGATSAARAVNDGGDVVGESWTAGGVVHAFLWRSGQMIDLNSRIPPGTGWVLTHASGINNTGAIVGWGRLDGKTRGFVLVPDAPCYPDCTGDEALTVADFGCFQTKFVAGDPYADCTGDGQLTVGDFGCFQTAFVAGCP